MCYAAVPVNLVVFKPFAGRRLGTQQVGKIFAYLKVFFCHFYVFAFMIIVFRLCNNGERLCWHCSLRLKKLQIIPLFL